jgi:hypothetical protein
LQYLPWSLRTQPENKRTGLAGAKTGGLGALNFMQNPVAFKISMVSPRLVGIILPAKLEITNKKAFIQQKLGQIRRYDVFGI